MVRIRTMQDLSRRQGDSWLQFETIESNYFAVLEEHGQNTMGWAVLELCHYEDFSNTCHSHNGWGSQCSSGPHLPSQKSLFLQHIPILVKKQVPIHLCTTIIPNHHAFPSSAPTNHTIASHPFWAAYFTIPAPTASHAWASISRTSCLSTLTLDPSDQVGNSTWPALGSTAVPIQIELIRDHVLSNRLYSWETIFTIFKDPRKSEIDCSTNRIN